MIIQNVICFAFMVLVSGMDKMEIVMSMTKYFAAAIGKCQLDEMHFAGDSIDDFLKYWNNKHTLETYDVGCVITCLSKKMGLLGMGAVFRKDNVASFVKQYKAGQKMSLKLTGLYGQCSRLAHATDNTDECKQGELLARCFRYGAFELKWAPHDSQRLRTIPTQPGSGNAGQPGGDFSGTPGNIYPVLPRVVYPVQPMGGYPAQSGARNSEQPGGGYPGQPKGGSPSQIRNDYPVGYPEQLRDGHPVQPGIGYQVQPGRGYPVQPGNSYPRQPSNNYPRQPRGDYPGQPRGDFPEQPISGYPGQPRGDNLVQQGTGYPQQPGDGYSGPSRD